MSGIVSILMHSPNHRILLHLLSEVEIPFSLAHLFFSLYILILYLFFCRFQFSLVSSFSVHWFSDSSPFIKLLKCSIHLPHFPCASPISCPSLLLWNINTLYLLFCLFSIWYKYLIFWQHISLASLLFLSYSVVFTSEPSFKYNIPKRFLFFNVFSYLPSYQSHEIYFTRVRNVSLTALHITVSNWFDSLLISFKSSFSFNSTVIVQFHFNFVFESVSP